jgi:hypothetical protein
MAIDAQHNSVTISLRSLPLALAARQDSVGDDQHHDFDLPEPAVRTNCRVMIPLAASCARHGGNCQAHVACMCWVLCVGCCHDCRGMIPFAASCARHGSNCQAHVACMCLCFVLGAAKSPCNLRPPTACFECHGAFCAVLPGQLVQTDVCALRAAAARVAAPPNHACGSSCWRANTSLWHFLWEACTLMCRLA